MCEGGTRQALRSRVLIPARCDWGYLGDEDCARSGRAWQEGAGRVRRGWRGSWSHAPSYEAAWNPPVPGAGRGRNFRFN